ncbi:MAG TPA: outer membrane protein assembly factor BamE [Devosia sp.]|nr:outer membrane protein assembly factor BamE [Devosia sp.]
MVKFCKIYRPLMVATVLGATLSLGACSGGMPGFSNLGGFSSKRTQGYEISDAALQQVRPGQSQDLVIAVMGSPQTRGTYENESAFYYVQTKIEETTFGLRTITDRKVLAVYFDDNKRVTDKAIYTLQDGRLFAIETRRTASFGEDRTFVEQILQSFGG